LNGLERNMVVHRSCSPAAFDFLSVSLTILALCDSDMVLNYHVDVLELLERSLATQT
jgi:hypothetical protein